MKKGGGRRKGGDFERAVVSKAIEYGFKGAHRTAPLQAGFAKVKDYPDIAGVGILWIEAKAYKELVPMAMVRAALDKERPGYVNAVVWKTDRSGTRVTLNFEDLLKLMNQPRANEALTQDELRDWMNGKASVVPTQKPGDA